MRHDFDGWTKIARLPFPTRDCISVREVWFVSSCHSRQGNSCVRAPLRLRSNLDSQCIRSFVLFRRGHQASSESSFLYR